MVGRFPSAAWPLSAGDAAARQRTPHRFARRSGEEKTNAKRGSDRQVADHARTGRARRRPLALDKAMDRKSPKQERGRVAHDSRPTPIPLRSGQCGDATELPRSKSTSCIYQLRCAQSYAPRAAGAPSQAREDVVRPRARYAVNPAAASSWQALLARGRLTEPVSADIAPSQPSS